MEKNVGQMDGLVRVIFGAFLGLVSLLVLGGVVGGPAILSPVLGILAVILLGTGLSGTCALYSLLGVRTN